MSDPIYLAGCRIDLSTPAEFSEDVRRALAGGCDRPLALASANLDHVYHFGARRRGKVPATDWPSGDSDLEWRVHLDGAPLWAVARVRSGRRLARLTGADMILPILEMAQDEGAGVAFLGGSATMQAQLGDSLRARYPELRFTGMWAPERSLLVERPSSLELAARIRDSGAEVLFVSLGKPLQEQWLSDYGALTGASLLVGYGAAADFVAGHVKRAPVWMRRAGVEWLYRLGRDPRRMWRRYLVQGPVCMVRVIVSRYPAVPTSRLG